MDAHTYLDLEMQNKYTMLSEQCQLKSLTNGDRNTVFPFLCSSVEKMNLSLSSMVVNGVLTSDRLAISDHVIAFYSRLFNFTDGSLPALYFDLISSIVSSLVTQEDNTFLTFVPSSEDIKDAIFSMDASKAPGPNGFSSKFFQFA